MVLLLKSNEKISFSLIIKYMNNFKDNFNDLLLLYFKNVV